MSALSKLTLTELKLFLRDPGAVLIALGLPTLLLVVLGSIPAMREPSQEFGGQRFIDFYAPSVAIIALVMLAFQVMPTQLGTYREKGVLRRMSTTPVHPMMLLIAQMVTWLLMAALATTVLIVVARVGFAVPLPQHAAGFGLALVLGTSAAFALGLVVAAVAPNARAATGIGALMFVVAFFFGGVYLPRVMLPDVIVRIGEFVPPGVEAIQDAWTGAGPQALHLVVMAAVTVAAGAVAARLFRWE